MRYRNRGSGVTPNGCSRILKKLTNIHTLAPFPFSERISPLDLYTNAFRPLCCNPLQVCSQGRPAVDVTCIQFPHVAGFERPEKGLQHRSHVSQVSARNASPGRAFRSGSEATDIRGVSHELARSHPGAREKSCAKNLAGYTDNCGSQVRSGRRQSMPSSNIDN